VILHLRIVEYSRALLRVLYGESVRRSVIRESAVCYRNVPCVPTREFESIRLPGLVSQSVILWDWVCLEWTRMAKGRLTVRLLAAA